MVLLKIIENTAERFNMLTTSASLMNTKVLSKETRISPMQGAELFRVWLPRKRKFIHRNYHQHSNYIDYKIANFATLIVSYTSCKLNVNDARHE